MELEQFEKDLEELDAELGEIETPPAKYQIWLFCYDEDDNILDDNALLFTYSDPDPAVKKAEQLSQDVRELERYATPKTAYFGIEVETIVDLEGYEENVGTLFQKFIPLEK